MRSGKLVWVVSLIFLLIGYEGKAQSDSSGNLKLTGLQLLGSLNSGYVKTNYEYHEIPLQSIIATKGYSLGIGIPFEFAFNTNERVDLGLELLYQHSKGNVLQENELEPSSEKFNRELLAQKMSYKTIDISSNLLFRYNLINMRRFKTHIGAGLGIETKIKNQSTYNRTITQFIDDNKQAVARLDKTDFREQTKLILLENILCAGFSLHPILIEYRFLPISRYHPEIERKGNEHVLMIGIRILY